MTDPGASATSVALGYGSVCVWLWTTPMISRSRSSASRSASRCVLGGSCRRAPTPRRCGTDELDGRGVARRAGDQPARLFRVAVTRAPPSLVERRTTDDEHRPRTLPVASNVPWPRLGTKHIASNRSAPPRLHDPRRDRSRAGAERQRGQEPAHRTRAAHRRLRPVPRGRDLDGGSSHRAVPVRRRCRSPRSRSAPQVAAQPGRDRSPEGAVDQERVALVPWPCTSRKVAPRSSSASPRDERRATSDKRWPNAIPTARSNAPSAAPARAWTDRADHLDHNPDLSASDGRNRRSEADKTTGVVGQRPTARA